MTRERAKELLPIIQAFAEGKEIQYCHDQGGWNPSPSPCWHNDCKYRVKPEPREWRATITKTGRLYAYDEGDERCADYEVIRVREVIEP